jgi:Tfp pilus assembly protein PilF
MTLRRGLLLALLGAVVAGGVMVMWRLRAENRRLAHRVLREDALHAMNEGRHADAAAAFRQVVREAPGDAEAAYLGAREADNANDYNNAREGYLQALRIDPRLGDARARLVELTARNGVLDEARHHLNKLEEIFGPSEPRVIVLKARLAAPQANAARHPDAGADRH